MTSTLFTVKARTVETASRGGQHYDDISVHVSVITGHTARRQYRTSLPSNHRHLHLLLWCCWECYCRLCFYGCCSVGCRSFPHTFSRLVALQSDFVPCRHPHQLAPAAAISLLCVSQLVVVMVSAKEANDCGCLTGFHAGCQRINDWSRFSGKILRFSSFRNITRI